MSCCPNVSVVPGPTRRRWLPGLALAVPLAALSVGRLLPGGLELELRPRDGGAPLLALPIEPDERFTLRYVHSVDRAPIWEVHSIGRDGCIYIEQERCVMFGAGMGHWPGHGRLAARGEYQVIDDIHEPVGSVVLRVGSPGVDHTLIWRGRRFNLTRLAAGEALLVSARSLDLGQRLWRRLGARSGSAARFDPVHGSADSGLQKWPATHQPAASASRH